MTWQIALAVSLLLATGTWLLTDVDRMRVVLGTVLLGHAAVLLLVGSRPRGVVPVLREGVDPSTVADPIPQALSLTAIVIAFGVTCLLLAVVGHALRSGEGET